MGFLRKREDENGNAKVIAAVIHLIMTIIIVAAIFGLFFVIGKMVEESRKPDITSAYISSKIETVSHLTTAELTYNGLIHYEEGDIPILTKKSFSMVYCAQVKAGVDLSKVESYVTDTEVVLIVPEVEIQEIDIDETSIQFYDEQVALFNWEEKEDTLDAMAAAKADVEEKVNLTELKLKARTQTESLLKGLFEGNVGEREVRVQFK
ncbi:MAG: DUF4230 domain-containing protein [Lachnospiraceae bacterium]|nr:DUF4230 domain-containing protein [Lachnospiraceae bacterium]